MNRFLSILFGAFGVFISLGAQQVVMFSLDDCLKEAVANNMKLRNADNEVLMSKEQRQEALTKYFPTVSASGTGLAANRHLLQMNMGDVGVGLVKHGVMANVVVMQPVFAGGQITTGNSLAKVCEEASHLQRNMTVSEVLLNTETYYWQIVMLKEKLHTISQVDKQLEQTGKDAEAAVEAGIRNRNDLLQVQLRRNDLRATRIEVENNLSVLTDLLAQYIGHMKDSLIIASPFDGSGFSPSLPENPASLYVSPEVALQQTNEFQLLGKQVDAEKLKYRLSVGKNLPSVAVGGGYVYNNLMDQSTNRLVGLLTVSVPISGWWGGSHNMKRQKLQAQNASNDLRDQSQQLVIRMQKAWHGVNDAYKQINISIESIRQSEENLRLHTDYYHTGTSTISDWLDAQTLYQQSRDKYVEAYTRFEVKKREYLQATGR